VEDQCSSELTAHATVRYGDGTFWVESGWGSAQSPTPISRLSWLVALETLVHEHRVSEAYALFDQVRGQGVPSAVRSIVARIHADLSSSKGLTVDLTEGRLVITGKGTHRAMDLSAASRAVPHVLRTLADGSRLDNDLAHVRDMADFRALVALLARKGLIVPARGAVSWGDLRRLTPICSRFGFSRGEPVDRYYLRRWLDEIRDEVTGVVVELGGKNTNVTLYGFSKASEYHALDLDASSAHVDIQGDVLDATALEPESADTILLFNVLEHCPSPETAVVNVRRWLRAGGRVFCMVPSVQRSHRYPKDYWRPLPDAMTWLFRDYDEVALRVFGNPTAAVACLMGIAADELDPAELDAEHADFPVATCLRATKRYSGSETRRSGPSW